MDKHPIEFTDTDETDIGFRAQLAALIQSNANKPHPNPKGLQVISKQVTKVADELASLRDKYLQMHGIKENEPCPLMVDQTQMGLTYAIHECHKVITYFENEYNNATK